MIAREKGGDFWERLVVRFLIFREGVGERAGTSALDIDSSVSDDEGTTSFAEMGEIIVGRRGLEVELGCSRDERPVG